MARSHEPCTNSSTHEINHPNRTNTQFYPKPSIEKITPARLACLCFASSFDWFTGLSVSFVIGQSDYFGFGLTTFSRKPLYDSQSKAVITLEDSILLITSELTNQRVRKALFTCVVYTNYFDQSQQRQKTANRNSCKQLENYF